MSTDATKLTMVRMIFFFIIAPVRRVQKFTNLTRISGALRPTRALFSHSTLRPRRHSSATTALFSLQPWHSSATMALFSHGPWHGTHQPWHSSATTALFSRHSSATALFSHGTLQQRHSSATTALFSHGTLQPRRHSSATALFSHSTLQPRRHS